MDGWIDGRMDGWMDGWVDGWVGGYFTYLCVWPCPQATRSGGVMVAVGLDPPEVRLPVTNAAMREVDIRGTFSYGHGE